MRAIVSGLGLLAACGGTVGDGDGIMEADEKPQPGWIADLTTRHHDVAGTATIVDERTIEVSAFTYDGGGVNTQWYLFPDGGSASSGASLSDNLVGTSFSDEVVTITLPDGVTFDDGNLLSLWCVPFDASFGDGVFEPPI